MVLLCLLIGAAVACLTGAALLHRVRMPDVLRVLGAGGWHYLALGILAGLGLRQDGTVDQYLPEVARGLVAVCLVWVGLEVGLDFDLRRFRLISPWRTGAEVAHVLIAAVLTAAIAAPLLPALAAWLGFGDPSGLALLALCGFVASVRMPEFLIVWRRGAVWLPPDAPASLSAATNPMVLVLYALAFPAVAAHPVLVVGPFEAVGYAWWLAVILATGLILGVCLDFLYRAHRDGGRSTFLSLGVVVSLAGACQATGIPAIAAGFVGGAWLVNATVRRREVLELSERVGVTLEPVLLSLLGCLIAVDIGLDLRASVVIAAVALFVGRGTVRTASTWVACRLAARSWRAVDTLGLGWRPAGILAVSLVAQSALLAPGNALARLAAPALCAVFLTQLVPAPVFREPRTARPSLGPVTAAPTPPNA